jgi:hypothetical protein
VPLKRLCDLALLAPPLVRWAGAVPRTRGMDATSLDLACRPGAPFSTPAKRVLDPAFAARATNPAVERFYTTVVPIRERATEGWLVSTLTTKETRSSMKSGKAAMSPVSRWGVAEVRNCAVFCQIGPARPPRSFAFDIRCGRPVCPVGLRRDQDMKHEQ